MQDNPTRFAGFVVSGVPPGGAHRVLEAPFDLPGSAIECARLLDDAGWIEVRVWERHVSADGTVSFVRTLEWKA